MKFEGLLADVNLSNINFSAGSSRVVLSFLNMSDGGSVGSLICDGVTVFDYRTLPGNGLPQYVGEVNHALIASNEVPALLDSLRYSFSESNGHKSIRHADAVHHVHIEGGVVIEIVCEEVKLLPK